ncbi:MAG TPA: hypothetical protein VJ739_00460, partial [Gemmataceae bacterium]|nr:hypothetical protein [Gemmataceae bacterium]
MTLEKPARRMTLRQLLTHSEKVTRDLIEQLQASVLPAVGDFRDLNRPVRRRSHYPTMVALVNSMHKVERTSEETRAVAEYLL